MLGYCIAEMAGQAYASPAALPFERAKPGVVMAVAFYRSPSFTGLCFLGVLSVFC